MKVRAVLLGIAALALAATVWTLPTELGNGSPTPSSSPVPQVGAQGVADGMVVVPPTPTPTVSPLCAGPAPVTPPPDGLTGEHWVDVSISQQITTLYIGTTPVQQFCVSTGAPGTHDTPQGTFHVYAKWPMVDLHGGSGADAYYYKDVKWVVPFDGVYYFHTAYWNNSFGTPISHGCVNMREDDAKVLYDFVSLGDRVVVHE